MDCATCFVESNLDFTIWPGAFKDHSLQSTAGLSGSRDGHRDPNRSAIAAVHPRVIRHRKGQPQRRRRRLV